MFPVSRPTTHPWLFQWGFEGRTGVLRSPSIMPGLCFRTSTSCLYRISAETGTDICGLRSLQSVYVHIIYRPQLDRGLLLPRPPILDGSRMRSCEILCVENCCGDYTVGGPPTAVISRHVICFQPRKSMSGVKLKKETCRRGIRMRTTICPHAFAPHKRERQGTRTCMSRVKRKRLKKSVIIVSYAERLPY